ncbi:MULTISPECIES: N-formylglutamate amidohydrolase [Rhodobacterales]|jgi:N-formylglutamate deformylase|uniref:N-formylglutamate amidohydrolase n=1 Tax=Rhodobacterales TaxID=204455 RepID=UPI00237F289C|nr:N-formylglutamate amidohydrolase [Phaeobacter gallaeciensis]MDE4141417.1 N-formylglutamate amidohydrolase [Phaeobacter gallaeciensis]MDE4149862.1 N-formylglutamate amidohydrolase [Phaeobacter gallaeciensis]MDE4154087.1 N-formylglutamate amidohydrolase [Phaeobacter gallaeciensis]MDE4229743.1 N-formylglutamate amidohydrolase [Phaeobacter gallaeciensis]MDE4258553.1 N-formylglutamate amidohydrolase [Phaeobacter gallaeciensis]
MSDAAFSVMSPQNLRSAIVFASPHSGADYPPQFLEQSILDPHRIRSSEDAFVDRLFAAAPEYGAPLLRAVKPRAYLDLNRSPEELDPALIEGVMRRGQNPRVASGLGVIPRVVAGGQAIYRGKLPLTEARRRIDSYWRPYHRALQGLLDQAHIGFGHAILIDCHSMPHEALETMPTRSGQMPDVVLGDRFGAAAAGEIVDRVEAAFTSVGLRVARNAPFAGAYITQAYGRPSRNQHAIQVEIDRSLYMDEATIRPNGNFAILQDALRGVIAAMTDSVQEQPPLAAE